MTAYDAASVPFLPGRSGRGFFVSGRGEPGPLRLRHAGVVSTSEAGTDDAGNVTSRKVEVRISGHNGHTTRHFSAGRKVVICLSRVLARFMWKCTARRRQLPDFRLDLQAGLLRETDKDAEASGQDGLTAVTWWGSTFLSNQNRSITIGYSSGTWA